MFWQMAYLERCEDLGSKKKLSIDPIIYEKHAISASYSSLYKLDWKVKIAIELL